MDILDDELLKFWRTLNNNHVKYIMVGGGHFLNKKPSQLTGLI